MSKVRVRFAPSPTGLLHLGNIRAALFNWLFARQQKGTFILRFEDTDRERLVPESVAYVKESLQWLGLGWDEGPDTGGPHEPYVQSERLDIYRQRAEILLQDAWAYPCWCSPERLDELRKTAQALKKPYKYDRHCLKHPGDPKEPHVLRFKIDEAYDPEWEDVVRGPLSQTAKELDDFVCIKSDGYPTYNFANVIDDHLMEISHVIRGEEFIASTPKFLQIYKAFGWEPPLFAHLPPVLGPDKTKLSKRHGAEPVLDYRDRGYLPPAIINFLASLGWNDGTTQEVFSSAELIKAFSLERVQKSPAIFDSQRLNWFNGAYIRHLPLEELAKYADPFWPPIAQSADNAQKHRVLKVLQERLKYLGELSELSSYFFESLPLERPSKLAAEFSKHAPDLSLANWLQEARELIQSHGGNVKKLEAALKERINAHGGKTKAALWTVLRLILANGAEQTPPIWELVYGLGKNEAIARIVQAQKQLEAA